MKKVVLTLMAALCLIWQSWQTQAQSLVNPNATKEAKALKAYMDDTYGKQIISGQYWDTWAEYVKTNTGRTPAILGLDFMDYTPRRRQEGANPSDIEKAIDWTNNRNGIVTFSWHWDAPTDIYDVDYRAECAGTTGGDARWWKAFYSCATYFDLNSVLNSPGSAKYNMIIRDIDIVAEELKKLQAAGVPVLWRPLHEASGQWFWWGARGPGPCKRLWALMYDRLTNHHQLNNLIWVWNCYGNQYGNPNEWFPGYNMVDIIAYDYPRSTSWSEYNTIHGGRGKLFGLAEVGGIPDPNNFSSARWSYFVTWSDFIRNNNSVDYIRRVYNDPRVVTLESLPNWKDFGFENNLAVNKPITVSSTEAAFGNVAANANDGYGNTRWSSAYSDPQWIQIDLGSRKQLSRVTLNWETASAKSYNLEISDDGINWTLISARTNMAEGARSDVFSGLTAKGRYVRMYGLTRNTIYGYSIYEFKIDGVDAPGGPVANAGTDQTVNDADNNGTQLIQLNGSASTLEPGTTATYSWKRNGIEIATGVNPSVSLAVGDHTLSLTVTDNNGLSSTDNVLIKVTEFQAPNLALNKPVTVSSTEATFGNVAVNANDGSATTRWSSAYADPQWIRIDLQAVYTINRVVLNWEAASARDYRIETSLDGTTWMNVTSRTNMAAGARIDVLSGLSSIGRFIRMSGTARTTVFGYSLFEFEVYGTPAGNINLPPTANAGADITVTDNDNNLTELVTLSGSASSDMDGSIASYAWTSTPSGLNSSLANPSVSFAVGTHVVTLTVTDDKGASSTDQMTVVVRPKETCTLLSRFGVPASSPLPSISNRTFSRVHVIGNGPNLNNVTSAVIQWELAFNGLWQFAFNTNNGVPAWYLNLNPLTSNTFNRSNPECRITGTRVARLDGEYWVKMDGANFVMVAKSGSHALYFSNSSTAPTGCNQLRSLADSELENSLNSNVVISPSILNQYDAMTISIPDEFKNGEISIVNTKGTIIHSFKVTDQNTIMLDQNFSPGLYILNINNGDQVRSTKFIVN
jgi:hypothetical protein